jgi:hypothetical protein
MKSAAPESVAFAIPVISGEPALGKIFAAPKPAGE